MLLSHRVKFVPSVMLISVAICFLSLIALTGCSQGSKSATVAATKLTPEEEGNLTLLKPNIDNILRKYNSHRASLASYWKHKNAGEDKLAEPHFNAQWRWVENIKVYLRNLKSPPSGQVQLLPAAGFEELFDSLLNIEKYRFQLDSGSLNQSEYEAIIALAQDLYEADSQLSQRLSARSADYGGVRSSSNFTAELGFMKVDFAKNEVKVKHSWKTGPLKWSAGIGPGKGGIKTLVIQNSIGKRVFTVGGKPIEVYVEDSIIRTDGDVMTVTAVNQ